MMKMERSQRKKAASTYNLSPVDEAICCLCGSKSKDSVSVNERIFPNRDDIFAQALGELLEKEDWWEENVITSENRACSHCYNLCLKILQLLEEVRRHKVKLKNTITSRHKTEAKEPRESRDGRENQPIFSKGEKSNRIFDCEICNKTFTRKASLLEHAARHKGIRDRECKVCVRDNFSCSPFAFTKIQNL